MFKQLQPAERKYSVCIGVNTAGTGNYLANLRYAESDAQAVDEVLGSLGFLDENRILLLGENATLGNINAALSEFILDRPKKNDLAVFYFSGHSFAMSIRGEKQDIDLKREFFLAHYDLNYQKMEQNPSLLNRQSLGMLRLRRDFFEGGGSNKRLFVFDCSYSGTFLRSDYLGYVQDAFNINSTGRVALLSAFPLSPSREDAIFGHGLFTYHLLQGLSGKALGAVRSDGYLTINTLFEYIADQLPPSQRSVLGGVQQDPLVLAHYTELAIVKHSLREKIAQGAFDVFLCYNSRDRILVKEIATLLKEQGILPWLDEWELPPGQPWQPLLEQQIKKISAVAVFVGKDGIGPWQRQEIDATLHEFVNRQCPVIPVLLTSAPEKPQLPSFLGNMTWVDFRKQDPDPMKQLIWGITRKRPLF